MSDWLGRTESKVAAEFGWQQSDHLNRLSQPTWFKETSDGPTLYVDDMGDGTFMGYVELLDGEVEQEFESYDSLEKAQGATESLFNRLRNEGR